LRFCVSRSISHFLGLRVFLLPHRNSIPLNLICAEISDRGKAGNNSLSHKQNKQFSQLTKWRAESFFLLQSWRPGHQPDRCGHLHYLRQVTLLYDDNPASAVQILYPDGCTIHTKSFSQKTYLPKKSIFWAKLFVGCTLLRSLGSVNTFYELKSPKCKQPLSLLYFYAIHLGVKFTGP
jgi:hypothetical protein